MPLSLYLQREPRTLILVSDEHCLVFRKPPNDVSSRPTVVVDFMPREEVDLEIAVAINSRVFGCLGALKVGEGTSLHGLGKIVRSLALPITQAGLREIDENPYPSQCDEFAYITDTFLAIITASLSLGSQTRSISGIGTEPINRILSVEFFCLTSPSYDLPRPGGSGLASADKYAGEKDYYDDFPSAAAVNGSNVPGSRSAAGPGGEFIEHPCAGIKKIISNGSFYYSSGENAFDLSTRLEARMVREERRESRSENLVEENHVLTREDAAFDAEDENTSDEDSTPDFLWNSFMISPLLSFRKSLPLGNVRSTFDQLGYLVLAIQGYVGVYNTISLGGQPCALSLISRLGWKRAGTRFNVRGADDDGNVANFVETETILRTPAACFSFVQTRGSVPLFWEELSQQPFGSKITITRPPESSLPAFLRHFEGLLDIYGNTHIINLLSAKDQEATLTEAYSSHLTAASSVDDDIREKVQMTNFDFHFKSKLGGGIEGVTKLLYNEIGHTLQMFGGCIVNVDVKTEKASLLVGQRGVFRTNCKDCLDRTNVVEDALSRFALEDFIAQSSPNWSRSDSSLWGSHRILFAENGDALSKIYVGTGAINTSFTRSGKKSFAGLLSDATKSVNRMYQSNFIDSGKQKAIDALLGHLSTSQKVRVFNPVNDTLHALMKDQEGEYTSYEPISIYVGSYNLNGKGPGTEPLLPWLFPTQGLEPDILVIAFQEIVALTPQTIMATDPEKKRRWESHIMKTVAERQQDKKSDYILLRSGQLVGTALIVLIKTSIANDVRNVEASTKKTGLKGMAGNKGAVAIRLDYKDSSFCFLTAHLAAGHSNVEERNADYHTIAKGLHFSRGRSIASHDNIVWAADTNYRISLPNEEVRMLALEDDYATLMAGDQLSSAMESGKAFAGYSEAPIIFRPTYKYDNGTNTYDTSEKLRIPAWTDRIIYKGTRMDVNRYSRAELMASDHRPVYAIFRSQLRVVDRIKRTSLRKRLLQSITVTAENANSDDRFSITNGKKACDLPLPSDDQRVPWWQDPAHPQEISDNVAKVPYEQWNNGGNPFDDGLIGISALLPNQKSRPPPIPTHVNAKGNVDEVINMPANKAQSPPSRRKQPPPPLPTFSSVESDTEVKSEHVATGDRLPPPIPTRPQRSGSTSPLPQNESAHES